MLKYICLSILLLASCKNNNDSLHQEIDTLKQKLDQANAELAAFSNTDTGFIHSVFFWFDDTMTDAQKEDFVKNGMEKLAQCEHLSSIYFGPPAGTPRQVVDNSYDYAWICHFKDKAAHDAYQVDPLHKKFVDQYSDLFKEVKIYDNLVM